MAVSCYFISSLWRCLCSCTHTMSMLWSIADAVCSGSCPILFKVLTLNVAICIVIFHLRNFCFCLNSVADFSNAGARAPTLAGRILFLPARRTMQFGHLDKSLPFTKKGDLRIAKNYRGITLTSIAAKIFNDFLLTRIEHKIEKILRKNQNGFQKKRFMIL